MSLIARDQSGGWGVMRVLIVDDSEPMRQMIKTYLADEKSLPHKGKGYKRSQKPVARQISLNGHSH